MPSIEKRDLEDAYHWISADGMENEAWLDLHVGHVYLASEFPDAIEELEPLPDDLHDSDRYMPLPGKFELDLGNHLVFRFVQEELPHLLGEVKDIFSRKGAYRQFTQLLSFANELERWHEYRNQATIEALQQWCAENHVKIIDTK
jgi:uncharacterized protein UPF0158